MPLLHHWCLLAQTWSLKHLFSGMMPSSCKNSPQQLPGSTCNHMYSSDVTAKRSFRFKCHLSFNIYHPLTEHFPQQVHQQGTLRTRRALTGCHTAKDPGQPAEGGVHLASPALHPVLVFEIRPRSSTATCSKQSNAPAQPSPALAGKAALHASQFAHSFSGTN